MANLKVRSLEHVMIYGVEESEFSEVPKDFPLIGRDGYYCRGEDVWFEYQGRGYLFGKTLKARSYFEYELVINDEAILMEREVRAMETILKTTRDATVKKALWARLNLHREALDLRNIRRQGKKQWIRIQNNRIAKGLSIL